MKIICLQIIQVRKIFQWNKKRLLDSEEKNRIERLVMSLIVYILKIKVHEANNINKIS